MSTSTGNRLYQFAKPCLHLYILSVVFAIIGCIGQLIPYYAISEIILSLLKKKEIEISHIILAVVGYAMQIVFANASTGLSHIATFKMISKIRYELVHKLAHISLGYINSVPSGSLKDTLIEKVDSIEPIMAHAVPEMSSSLIVPIMLIVYCFKLDWRISISMLVTMPIGFAALSRMTRDYEPNFKKYYQAGKDASSAVVEYINGIEVIKAFNQSAKSYEKYTKAVTKKADFAIYWMSLVQFWMVIGFEVWPGVLAGVLPCGCILYALQKTSLDAFVKIILISQGIVPPLIHAMSFLDNLAKASTIVNDFGSILDQPEIIRPKEEVKLKDYNIELKDVTFGYNNEPVISNISISIPQGKTVALVGPSGGGKSTIAKLIASQWDATLGEVTIGGINVKNIPFEQLAATIGYVSQDCYLFDDTIANNIRLWNPNESIEKVKEVAEESGCLEFINSLDNGLDTKVGDGGCHLSGGERQRISIARCMMKNTPIVILDEATAYIDPENEYIIQQSINKLVKGKTLLMIAHRLSTIVNADKIIVIQNGKVESEGTHTELLEKCPLYKRMWNAHIGAKDSE